MSRVTLRGGCGEISLEAMLWNFRDARVQS